MRSEGAGRGIRRLHLTALWQSDVNPDGDPDDPDWILELRPTHYTQHLIYTDLHRMIRIVMYS